MTRSSDEDESFLNSKERANKKRSNGGKAQKPRNTLKLTTSSEENQSDKDDSAYANPKEKWNKSRISSKHLGKSNSNSATTLRRNPTRASRESSVSSIISNSDKTSVTSNRNTNRSANRIAAISSRASSIASNVHSDNEERVEEFVTPSRQTRSATKKPQQNSVSPVPSQSEREDTRRKYNLRSSRESSVDSINSIFSIKSSSLAVPKRRRNPVERSSRASSVASNESILNYLPENSENKKKPVSKAKKRIQTKSRTSENTSITLPDGNAAADSSPNEHDNVSEADSTSSLRRNPSRSCKKTSFDFFSNYLQDSDLDDEDAPGAKHRKVRNPDEDDEDFLLPQERINADRPKASVGYIPNNPDSSSSDDERADIQTPRVVSPIDIGPMTVCYYCEARKFGFETYCCREGCVFVDPMQAIPEDLLELLFENTPQAKAFRNHILSYNTLFSLASIQRHRIPANPHGVQVQKVQGNVDAYPSSAFPFKQNDPSFAHYYVYAGQTAVDMRMKLNANLDKEIVAKLQRMMEDHNMMVKNYKMLKDVIEEASKNEDCDAAQHVRMKIINAFDVDKSKLQAHKGVYRSATQSCNDYVAVFYTASVLQHDIELPGLIIYPKRTRKNVLPIHYWSPQVDPLCYPLLFPYGEYGFARNKFKQQTKKEKSYWQRVLDYCIEFPEEMEKSELNVTIEQVREKAKITNPKKRISGVMETANEDVNETENSLMEIENPIESRQEEEEENEEELSSLLLSEEDDAVDDNSEERLAIAREHQAEVALEDQFDQDCVENDEDIFDFLGPDGEEEAANNEIEIDDLITNETENNEENDQSEPSNSEDSSSGEEDDDDDCNRKQKKREFISQRDWLVYQYQMREHIKNRFLKSGKVGQLYLIHSLTRILRGRYDKFRRHNSEKVKTTKSKFIKAMAAQAEKKGLKLGIVSLMAQTIAGSPRWLQAKFENAVTLCNRYGKIDLFITATCNTKWKEIVDNLEEGQTWADNPFLVNNVFREKFKKLLEMIAGKKLPGGKRTKGIFGKIRWYSYSIEFQQRGPPHAHLVVSLKNHIKNVGDIEKAVQARLPPPGELRDIVEDFMMHAPCEGKPQSYCRDMPKYKTAPRCRKKFPMPFSDTTKLGDRHYPEYIRPDDGVHAAKNKEADNRYVVPYNTTLLSAWRGHMNVEVVSGLAVVKYIFKYLFKGFDRVLVETVTNSDNIDMSQMTVDGHLIYPKNHKIPPGALEKRKKDAINQLKKRDIKLQDDNGNDVLVYDETVLVQDMRALTSCEAAWDSAKFPRHGCTHNTMEQDIHEEDDEFLCFDPENVDKVAEKIKKNRIYSKLKAWFELNQVDERARKLLYEEIPTFYTYRNGSWNAKKRIDANIIGKIRTVPPKKKQAFAIRILCQNRKGMKSFKDLRTVDGEEYETFADAAKKLGLMNNQDEWANCLKEAATYDNPCKLRRLFCQIVTTNEVSSARKLYDDFRMDFFERKEWDEETKEAHSLYHIRSHLSTFGKTLEDYGLPKLNEENMPEKVDDWVDDSGSQTFNVSKGFATKLRRGLQDEQVEIFETIFKSILKRDKDFDEPNSYFLQGSGGTGKTVLMKALFYNLLAEKKKVACVAHTGIAASLLPGGTTAHRFFKIPLITEENMCCQVEQDDTIADFLSQYDCIIWDEATMTDRRVFNAVHRLMQKLHSTTDDRPFAGVHFILAGDFKQTLPIDSEERSVGIIKYTLLKWQMWSRFKIFELTKNRRAQEDEGFVEYLEEVGWGTKNIVGNSAKPEEELVKLPEECLVPTEADVIKNVYGGPGTAAEKLPYFKDSAILTVDNKTTFDINRKVLDLITGENEEVYRSIDTHDEKTGLAALNPECYHKVTPSGFPQHELKLKVGAVVILLRNINVAMGLTNGTRMIVTKLGKTVISLKHITPRKNVPEEVLLSRTLFAPSNARNREVAFTRMQFPVRLAFCITCNRAQGQTLKKAGIILRSPCFSHGQLYVALSRVRTRADLFIYNASSDRLRTNNVIFPEVFELLKPFLSKTGRAMQFLRRKTALATGDSNEKESEESDMQTGSFPQMTELDDHLMEIENEMREWDKQALIQRMIDEDPVSYYEQLEYEKFHSQDEDLMRYLESCYQHQSSEIVEEIPRNVAIKEVNKISISNKRTRNQINVDLTFGDSDDEYNELFYSDPTEAEERWKEHQASKKTKRITFASIDKGLRLLQVQNNCYANTATQIIYRLWAQEIKQYEGFNEIMLELQRIGAGKGDSLGLLALCPEYDETVQEDSVEFLYYLLSRISDVFEVQNSMEFYETTEHICKMCKTVSFPSNAMEETVVLMKSQEPSGDLHFYLNSTEKWDKIEKICCRGNKNLPHMGRQYFWIPETTKYLFMNVLQHRNDRTFIEREIEIPGEIFAFGCFWDPVVLLEHIHEDETGQSGHYVAYTKNNKGWLRINATSVSPKKEIRAISRIVMVVFEKITWDAECAERQRRFEPLIAAAVEAQAQRNTEAEAQRITSLLENSAPKEKKKVTFDDKKKNEEIPSILSAKKVPELGNNGLASSIRSLKSKIFGQSKASPTLTVQTVPKPLKRNSEPRKVINIIEGDMFEIETDALVNAANPELSDGGGVCGQIYRKAGRTEMAKACSNILKNMGQKTLPSGEAVITSSFKLANRECRAQAVVHTAAPAPISNATNTDECHLRLCYINSCCRASERGLKKLVFPFLGIGIYNYGKKEGIAVAIQAVLTFFEIYPNTSLQSVTFATMSNTNYKIALKLTGDKTALRFSPSQAAEYRRIIKENFSIPAPLCISVQIHGNNITMASFVALKAKNVHRRTSVSDDQNEEEEQEEAEEVVKKSPHKQMKRK